MAINFNSSAQIPIQKYGSFIKYANKELVYKRRHHAPQKKSPVGPVVLRISASIKNKVYEDQSEGIVCYQDESGEIICEGYDEGPTYRQISRPTHHSRRSFAEFRDAEIMSLLQKRWIEIVKGEEIDHADEDAHLLQEKFELQ